MNEGIPSSLGECADLLYTIRKERYAQQKIVEEYKKRESFLEAYLIEQLPKIGSTGVSGSFGSVSIKSKQVATPTDWSAIYNYIKEHNAFEVLTKSLKQATIKEYFENGDLIDGISIIEINELSITKL
jgi:hypothetical protein